MNSSPLQSQQAPPESGPPRTRSVRRPPGRFLAFALVATLGVYGLSDPSHGQSRKAAGLEGSWSGGGSVSFASGARERARCRAHYRRRTKDSYALRATCATASGSAAQNATIHKVGVNRYAGSFHNTDYDISGTIFVVVRGNTQSVRLTSSSGWATFRLSR